MKAKSPTVTKRAKTAKSAPKSRSKVRKKATTKAKSKSSPGDYWSLRLYVAGQTPRSLTAFANLKRLCEQFLANRHEIEVVDLTREPQRAKGDEIVALPTLVRKLPEPIKRIIGDLSNTERVLIGMDLLPLVGMHRATP